MESNLDLAKRMLKLRMSSIDKKDRMRLLYKHETLVRIYDKVFGRFPNVFERIWLEKEDEEYQEWLGED